MIGTGMGSGIIIDNRLYRGVGEFSMHLGDAMMIIMFAVDSVL
jgi:predicted NBD/HSP70 family sugar kinase